MGSGGICCLPELAIMRTRRIMVLILGSESWQYSASCCFHLTVRSRLPTIELRFVHPAGCHEASFKTNYFLYFVVLAIIFLVFSPKNACQVP